MRAGHISERATFQYHCTFHI